MTINSKLSKAALLRKLADVEEQLDSAYDLVNEYRSEVHDIALSRDNNAAELSKVAGYNKLVKDESNRIQHQLDKQCAKAEAYMDVIKEFIRKD